MIKKIVMQSVIKAGGKRKMIKLIGLQDLTKAKDQS